MDAMKTAWTVLLALTAFHPEALCAQNLSALFKQVRPAVVVITTEETEISAAADFQPVSTKGLGSGVFIEGGLILTAAHVVQTANVVLVKFYDGHESFANVAASSVQADVALLELEDVPEDVAPARLGDSDKVEVGDQIFVVGAPYGLSYTLTVGHISGRVASPTLTNNLAAVEYFQTDASINQGNSGGPMFNMDGEVVGIVSSILTKSGGFEGLGFAATSNVTRSVLLEGQSFWTGAEAYLLTGAMARLFNVPQEAGFLVQRVATDSPAHRLGLQPGYLPVELAGEEFMLGGDIILKMVGIAVGPGERLAQIQQRLSQLRPGDRLSVEVLRGGEIINLAMTY